MIHTIYVHYVYILNTSYIHYIRILHMFYVLFTYILYTSYTCFEHVPDMFRKSFGGRKYVFSKKFWGCLGYVFASSLVSKKGWKNLKSQLFHRKTKLVRIDAESPPDHFPLIRKFRSLQNDCFMTFSFFHIYYYYFFYFLRPHAAFFTFFIPSGVVFQCVFWFPRDPRAKRVVAPSYLGF